MNHKTIINDYIQEMNRLAGNFSRSARARADSRALKQGQSAAGLSLLLVCRTRLGDSKKDAQSVLEAAHTLYGLALRVA